MIDPKRRRLALALVPLLLTACATMRPGYEEPSVQLSDFRMLPADGLVPRFLIGLRVINPNNSPLDLRGLSYDVEIEGHKLITGVAGQLSRIPAYGESEIELRAGVDMLGGARILSQLLSDSGRETMRYRLRTRLDVGGQLRPLTLEDVGELRLAQGAAL